KSGIINPRVSNDGLTLVFDLRENAEPDLYLSTRPAFDAPWEEAVHLGPTVNCEQEDAYACVSQDRLTVVFLSKRGGEVDLYLASRKTPSEPFGEAVNLGPGINTGGYDWFPGLSADSRWLTYTGADNGRLARRESPASQFSP